MGKSPAKWIKTVLFGKKSAKSNNSKGVLIERKESNVVKAPSGDLALNSPVISHQVPQIIHRSVGDTELENGTTTSLPCGADHGVMEPSEVFDAEIIKQEEAATKAQAAFRGYLARRAFRALKGIIRLQALIRGHLVRRQAVATLRCMQAIVAIQRIVRGERVRVTDEVCDWTEGEHVIVRWMDVYRVEKLIKNSFICKLLASSPTAMPLSLQYNPVDPNSVNNWLERWSSYQFWEPLTQLQKPQKKQANVQSEDSEAGRPKRAVLKLTAVNGDYGSDCEKLKRNFRKVMNHQTEPVREQPQNELERVKRNLRKVSDRLEAAVEKPQQNLMKVSSSSTPDDSEQRMENSSDKICDKVADVSQSQLPVKETSPMPLPVDEPLDLHPIDQPITELQSPEFSRKVENTASVDETLSTSNGQTSKEVQRTRRRKSFPTTQEYLENVSQNMPILPSYMAATESAKAKVRAQGSLRHGDNGAENGFVRRHSLPSNGQLSSLSPRMQKPVLAANGKGGSKGNRSLTSSRDEKALQSGWRR